MTGIVNFTGNPAYKNSSNVFTETNEFKGDTVFYGRVSFPFNNIGSQSGNFTFDGILAGNQKVTLTGTSAHTCTIDNLVQGVNVLFVSQEGTGALTLALGTGNGDVT